MLGKDETVSMSLWTMVGLLVTLTALFSYLNQRFLKFPLTVGVMMGALMFSLLLIGLQTVGIPGVLPVQNILRHMDFNRTMLDGFLGFLLFAGALTIDLRELSRQKWVVGTLATCGVLLSTVVIGVGSYGIFGKLGLTVGFLPCLLFGALISPTDPIAVLALLKHFSAPHHLKMQLAGESLFNDGVGVVLFFSLLAQNREGAFHLMHFVTLFIRQALGGIGYGFLLGLAAYHLVRSVNDYVTEIMVTLALVSGGYALAELLGVSGPLAMVVAGLLIGNYARRTAMTNTTRHILDVFWHLVDELLNAVLFVLMGLELLLIPLVKADIWAMIAVIPLVLGARWVSIALPYLFLRLRRDFMPGAISILTWGGLRGGLAMAMALSLPLSSQRNVWIAVTYGVVIFSVLVQGTTVHKLLVKDTVSTD